LDYKDGIEDKVQEEVGRRVAAAEEAASARVAEAAAQRASNERRLAAALESMRQAQAAVDRSQAQVPCHIHTCIHTCMATRHISYAPVTFVVGPAFTNLVLTSISQFQSAHPSPVFPCFFHS
jgi:hypothetical protein